MPVRPPIVAGFSFPVCPDSGWLELDRTLTPDEYAHLRASIPGFAERDHTWRTVIDAFGAPSVPSGVIHLTSCHNNLSAGVLCPNLSETKETP